MAGSIAIPKPHLRLIDPAEAQRPLTFYVRAVRRRWVMITLLSVALTALVVLVCAMLPPVSVGSATIAIDRQAAPETIGDNHLLSTGDDQFMATQQNLLLADIILRPVTERYNLLEREHQLRRYWFWRYSPTREKAIRNAPIILKHLKIERKPNTYLLTITYRDQDPQVAANAANALRIPTYAIFSRPASRKLGGLLPLWNGS
jgi:polysaccharide biosynthesis transport protein